MSSLRIVGASTYTLYVVCVLTHMHSHTCFSSHFVEHLDPLFLHLEQLILQLLQLFLMLSLKVINRVSSMVIYSNHTLTCI